LNDKTNLPNTPGFQLVILTKKELKILSSLVDSVFTITEASKKTKLSYQTIRKHLRNLEKRGVLVSITNLRSCINQKLYKINPEVAETIKEMF